MGLSWQLTLYQHGGLCFTLVLCSTIQRLSLVNNTWLSYDTKLKRPHPSEREARSGTKESRQWKQSGPTLTQLWPKDGTSKGTTIDLTTQSPDTWQVYENSDDRTNSPAYWLGDEDMLPSKFRNARIFTFDWPSITYRDAIEDCLLGYAKTFLDRLQYRSCPNRHMIMIASCYGGLLLAKAITLAADNTSEHHDMLRYMTSMLFLGTPFGKTDAANAAQIRVRVARAMGGDSCGWLVSYLSRHNRELNEVVQHFERIVHSNHYSMRLLCYYETRKTHLFNAILPKWVAGIIPWGKLILVPEDSARIGGFPSVALHVRHGLLNKFSGRNDRNFETICNGLQGMIDDLEVSDVDKMLKQYYEHQNGRRLRIERISGDYLPMENCYINLCIVNHDRTDIAAATDTSFDKFFTDSNASKFLLVSRSRVENTSTTEQVTLQTMFHPRGRANGKPARPNRVLIWGRAGVGKTTLCKKIVHDFLYQGLWNDLFDYVFWIPLRELKLETVRSDDLEDLILKKFFPGLDNRELLRKQLQDVLGERGSWQHKQGQKRALFILDGLDEISYALDPAAPMTYILEKLLQCDNTIITSRPHDTSLLYEASPDIELETVGFFPAQVEQYLEMVKEQTGEPVFDISAFIETHPIIQGLASIPIQLDAICYCWRSNFSSTNRMTMTILYQKIELKLWEKCLTWRDSLVPSRIRDSAAITELVENGKIPFLEKLAFNGLHANITEFNVEHIRKTGAGLKAILNDNLVHMPFLRCSDTSMKSNVRTYHFLHFTFQEYFAARYFVRHWVTGEKITLTNHFGHRKSVQRWELIEPRAFLRQMKYNARYDVFWRFVAVSFQAKTGENLRQFFALLESEPCDIFGSTHQRLIVRCLNELDPSDDDFRPKAQRLEQDYLKHVLFEQSSRASTRLGREVECSERIIEPLLQGSLEMKKTGMKCLSQRQNLSPSMLDMVMHELETNVDDTLRMRAYQVLACNCNQGSAQRILDFWRCFDRLGPGERRKATRWLEYAKLQQPAVDALVQQVQSEDWKTRVHAVSALGKCDEAPQIAITDLVQLLNQEHENVRTTALRAFLQNSRLAQWAITDMSRLLECGGGWALDAATRVLSSQKDVPNDIVVRLIQLLKYGSDETSNAAICVLSHQGNLPNDTVKRLVHLLEQKDEEFQRHAADALRKQTQLPDTVVGHLIGLLDHERMELRRTAANALGGHSKLPAVAIARLIQMLAHEEDDELGSFASWTLYYQSQMSEDTITHLVRLLQRSGTEDVKLRYRVTIALSQDLDFPQPQLISLIKMVGREDHSLRLSASKILNAQKLLPEIALASLVSLLKHESKSVRLRAAHALGNQDQLPETVVADLIRMLEDEQCWIEVIETIAKQTHLSQQSLMCLLSLTQHGKPILELHGDDSISDQMIKRLLRGRRETYHLPSTLDQDLMRKLLVIWFDESFSKSLACVVVDESLVVLVDGTSVTTPLTEDQLNVVRGVQQEIREMVRAQAI